MVDKTLRRKSIRVELGLCTTKVDISLKITIVSYIPSLLLCFSYCSCTERNSKNLITQSGLTYVCTIYVQLALYMYIIYIRYT